MKIWLFITLGLLLFISFVSAQDTLSGLEQRYNEQEDKIDWISRNLSWLIYQYEAIDEKFLEYYNMTVGATNAIASKWLEHQTIILWIFALIIAIWSIYISIKVNEHYQKTIEAKNKSEVILEKVEELKWRIDNNSELIYKKMLDAETDYIFSKLQKEPLDIENFFRQLVTRNLDLKYYQKLEELLNYFDTNSLNTKKFRCLQIIFQHFPEKLIASNNLDMWNYFINHNKELIEAAFASEVEKSLTTMAQYIITINEDIYNNRYSEYLQELNVQKVLEKNNYTLLHKIYKTFLDHNKEDLFQEICSNISLDHTIVTNVW